MPDNLLCKVYTLSNNINHISAIKSREDQFSDQAVADRLEGTSFDFARIVSLPSFIRLEFCYQQDEIGFVPEPCW